MKVMYITYKRVFCVTHVFQHMRRCFPRFCSNGVRKINIPEIYLDTEYLCNSANKENIKENIRNRKGVGNIDIVQELYYKLHNSSLHCEEKSSVFHEFIKEINLIPNKSSPFIKNYGDVPKVVKVVGNKKQVNFKPKEFSDITKHLHLMRTDNLSNLSGHKSYYFMGDLADMEWALVTYSVKDLISRRYQIVSVPDILNEEVIERCGMKIRGDRTQVYMLDNKLYPGGFCLSGTAEMALAGYLANRKFEERELPLRLAAVSRCYRAETSKLSEEKGIYRVHQFTKVEMFMVTKEEDSDAALEELLETQEKLFAPLGLQFQVLDMPPHELGAPAFRKYDIEAWMPGRQMYGEISSCSNCTDYQSRRLNIRYGSNNLFAHTVNGTACAVPRVLIALLETHQQANGSVAIPELLQPFMGGKHTIYKQNKIPHMQFIKKKDRD